MDNSIINNEIGIESTYSIFNNIILEKRVSANMKDYFTSIAAKSNIYSIYGMSIFEKSIYISNLYKLSKNQILFDYENSAFVSEAQSTNEKKEKNLKRSSLIFILHGSLVGIKKKENISNYLINKIPNFKLNNVSKGKFKIRNSPKERLNIGFDYNNSCIGINSNSNSKRKTSYDKAFNNNNFFKTPTKRNSVDKIKKLKTSSVQIGKGVNKGMNVYIKKNFKLKKILNSNDYDILTIGDNYPELITKDILDEFKYEVIYAGKDSCLIEIPLDELFDIFKQKDNLLYEKKILKLFPYLSLLNTKDNNILSLKSPLFSLFHIKNIDVNYVIANENERSESVIAVLSGKVELNINKESLTLGKCKEKLTLLNITNNQKEIINNITKIKELLLSIDPVLKSKLLIDLIQMDISEKLLPNYIEKLKRNEEIQLIEHKLNEYFYRYKDSEYIKAREIEGPFWLSENMIDSDYINKFNIKSITPCVIFEIKKEDFLKRIIRINEETYRFFKTLSMNKKNLYEDLKKKAENDTLNSIKNFLYKKEDKLYGRVNLINKAFPEVTSKFYKKDLMIDFYNRKRAISYKKFHIRNSEKDKNEIKKRKENTEQITNMSNLTTKPIFNKITINQKNEKYKVLGSLAYNQKNKNEIDNNQILNLKYNKNDYNNGNLLKRLNEYDFSKNKKTIKIQTSSVFCNRSKSVRVNISLDFNRKIVLN